MPRPESIPILYALDGSGDLRHVDDVPNGEASGCCCPDPSCSQALVAKSGGEKKIHHFAHKRGSCAWSAENVVARLACAVLEEGRRLAFPKLDCLDACKQGVVELTPARRLHLAGDVSLEGLSGRGAPEVVVQIEYSDGRLRRFALLFSLVHGLNKGQLQKLSESGIETILVDLRVMYREERRRSGKHFDRAELLASFQAPRLIAKVLTGEDEPCKKWVLNSKRDEVEAAAGARADEEARRRREETARQRAAAKRRVEEEQEAARARLEKEREARRVRLEEERLLLELREKATLDELDDGDRDAILEAIKQQQTQARDRVGRRWARCEVCGEVRPTDSDFFASFGGQNRVNLGICKRCQHERDEQKP